MMITPMETMNTEDTEPKNEEARSAESGSFENERADERRHFESCSNAFKAGKEDATAKAREAAPKMKSAVTETVHDVAYGLAYGAFFAGAFAHELLPKSVKDAVAKGIDRGSAAGRNAAEKVTQPDCDLSTGEGSETIVISAPA